MILKRETLKISWKKRENVGNYLFLLSLDMFSALFKLMSISDSQNTCIMLSLLFENSSVRTCIKFCHFVGLNTKIFHVEMAWKRKRQYFILLLQCFLQYKFYCIYVLDQPNEQLSLTSILPPLWPSD